MLLKKEVIIFIGLYQYVAAISTYSPGQSVNIENITTAVSIKMILYLSIVIITTLDGRMPQL